MTKNFFVPSSLLNEMRREAVEKLITNRHIRYRRQYVKTSIYDNNTLFPLRELDYTANISNIMAEDFYRVHGVEKVEPAYENKIRDDVPLMYTKHCLRYSMGWCPVHHKKESPYKEPYYLVYKEKRLRLSFDCKKCLMLVY